MVENMKQVISVHGDQILMEGIKLNELINMNKMSADNFLDLLEIYISLKNEQLSSCDIMIRKSEQIMFRPANKFSSVRIGEVLVDSKHYNQLKSLIFDFAFEKCSSEIIDSSYNAGYRALINNLSVYTCTYMSPTRTINQMISTVPINREEQAKKKALLKIK